MQAKKNAEKDDRRKKDRVAKEAFEALLSGTEGVKSGMKYRYCGYMARVSVLAFVRCALAVPALECSFSAWQGGKEADREG